MPKIRYKFNEEQCEKWKLSKDINPITRFPINTESKYGVYAQLTKQCLPKIKGTK